MSSKTTIARSKENGHPSRAISLDFIKKSGRALLPPEYTYQGSAVVHFYEHKSNAMMGQGGNFAFVAHHTEMGDVPEQQASAGVQELSRALMSVYGRQFKDKTDIKLVK